MPLDPAVRVSWATQSVSKLSLARPESPPEQLAQPVLDDDVRRKNYCMYAHLTPGSGYESRRVGLPSQQGGTSAQESFLMQRVRKLSKRAHGHGYRRLKLTALGVLALGTVAGFGASPVAAVPSIAADDVGRSSAMSRVNEATIAGDLDRARHLSQLGVRYMADHELGEAEAAFREALAIAEAALGPTDPRLVDSIMDLADVRFMQRDFTGAEPLYQRAVAVVETTYGPHDSRLIGPLAELAGFYRTWEHWDDAILIYLRLAGVFERMNGADDVHVALILDYVAECYAAEGRYADAEQVYARVLTILTPRFGSNDPLVQQVRAEHARARREREAGGPKKG
jgi:tetratricopeptide (TPR) repeat protein